MPQRGTPSVCDLRPFVNRRTCVPLCEVNAVRRSQSVRAVNELTTDERAAVMEN
jgi:hypothetical protein